MNKNNRHRMVRAAGAAVAGALALSAPMFAVPSSLPTAAAACDKWKFPVNQLSILQDGQELYFQTGPAFGSYSWENIEGPAEWYTKTKGIASGSISGRSINFTVNWDNGGRNVYTGQVNDDLTAGGTTTDSKGATTKWRSMNKFLCITAPVPEQQAPPPPEMRTVARDRDVYPAPNVDNGLTPVGILRANSQVEVVGSCSPRDWCQLKGPDVPTGQGWAWGPFDLDDN